MVGNEEHSVIITGGSSGIGLCTALLFAKRGWRVGLIARGAAGLASAVAAVQAEGAPMAAEVAAEVADVADGAALERAAAAIAARLGTPAVWINCAGNGVYGRFDAVPVAEYDRVTAVTYAGTVNGTRVALALMAARGAGTVVNVCSAIAFHGMPLMTSYAGAKAAVRGFGQALRAELRMAGSDMRVCTVFPPAVNTPFFSHAVSHMGWPARPAPPVYQPEVIAAGIYLAARLAPPELAITGTAALFSLACRISPRSIAWAMTRLGFDGQLTRDAAAAAAEVPTLFAPAEEAARKHGTFGDMARSRSLMVGLSYMVAAMRPAMTPLAAPAPRLGIARALLKSGQKQLLLKGWSRSA
jgi:short-subunit dehydrogenase